jgi:hypothetical protein
MSIFSMLFTDPVAIYSTVGLLILFGIAGYYVYYFAKKIHEDG